MFDNEQLSKAAAGRILEGLLAGKTNVTEEEDQLLIKYLGPNWRTELSND